MALDTLPALLRIPTVSAIPDTSQTNPDDRKRREQPRDHHEQSPEETPHTQPVVNIDGQITGRLIDTTA
ncbi:protein of unknown function [Sterolibacterium denitrificans]|uniref:Uncharacterized protein n=2 Tax=Sterolibacterium denitrificans TaxID=157592 RepID=A0A7Z7HTU1_9PROT|nr:hypothetical protein [Sterolibacterium denitrificans]KYC29397.1 hypothetical protein ACY05_02475 [Sterolibacterium denitrificans]SMB31321.1 protein of unknown function [Sterolibacterium denitrificans]